MVTGARDYGYSAGVHDHAATGSGLASSSWVWPRGEAASMQVRMRGERASDLILCGRSTGNPTRFVKYMYTVAGGAKVTCSRLELESSVKKNSQKPKGLQGIRSGD